MKAILFLCLGLVLTSCGGGSPATPQTPTIPPRIMEVTPASATPGTIPVAGEEGAPVIFQATGLNTPVSWEWDFGGGTSPLTSTQATPLVRLRAEGTYSGRVRASNGVGGSEWFDFTYQVSAPTSQAGRPEFTFLDAGGDLGPIGRTAQLGVEGFFFPSSWSWNFPGGTAQTTVDEHRPQVDLISPGIFQGSVTLGNRHGSTLSNFIYSVGGHEPDRMSRQWGGVWTAAVDPIVFSDGGIAVMGGGRYASWITDLDPGFTTGSPSTAWTYDGVREPDQAEVWVFAPDGRRERRIVWDACPLIPYRIWLGPADSILLIGVIPADAQVEHIDLDPGTGVTTYPESQILGSLLLQISREGDLLMAYPDRRGIYPDIYGYQTPQSTDHRLATSANGTFAYLRGIEPGNPLNPYGARQEGLIFGAGEPKLIEQDLREPWALTMTPEGDVLVACSVRDESNSFTPPDPRQIGWFDLRLNRYAPDGSLKHQRVFGGDSSPDGVGPNGGAFVFPDGLVCATDGTVLLAGTWFNDVLDLDPGPGEDLHWLPAPCEDVNSTRSNFVVRLNADDLPIQTLTWASREPRFRGNKLVPLADGGFAYTWRLNPCIETPEQRDLDPGPGLMPFSVESDHAIVVINAEGNYERSLEFMLPRFPSGEARLSLIPSLQGGLYCLRSPLPVDLDPGPAVVDSQPWLLPGTNSNNRSCITCLDSNLNWSSPAAP